MSNCAVIVEMNDRLLKRNWIFGCLVLIVVSAVQSTASVEARSEVEYVRIEVTECIEFPHEICSYRWEPSTEREIFECRTVWIEFCSTVVYEFILVWKLESEEERKNRIVKEIDEFITTGATEMKKTCDQLNSETRDHNVEDESEYLEMVCGLIDAEYKALTHEVSAFEIKDLPDDRLGECDGEGFLDSDPRTTIRVDMDDIESDYSSHRWDYLVREVIVHERLHSQDYIEGGTFDRDHDTILVVAKAIAEALGNTGVDWKPKRTELLEVRSGMESDRDE